MKGVFLKLASTNKIAVANANVSENTIKYEENKTVANDVVESVNNEQGIETECESSEKANGHRVTETNPVRDNNTVAANVVASATDNQEFKKESTLSEKGNEIPIIEIVHSFDTTPVATMDDTDKTNIKVITTEGTECFPNRFPEKLFPSDSKPLFQCGNCKRLFDKTASYVKHLKYPETNIKVITTDGTECIPADDENVENCDKKLGSSEFKPKFQCGKCKRLFDKPSTYVKHLKYTEKVEATVMCDQCSKIFPDERRLDYHMMVTHSNSDNQCVCPECKLPFQHPNLLKVHMSIQHVTRKCPFCPQEFPSRRVLQKHKLEAHSDKRTIACPQCDVKCFTKKYLQHHTTQCHKPADCKLCKKTFPCKRELGIHQRREHNLYNSNLLKCKDCDFQCPKRITLHRHYFRKHGIGKGG